MVAFRKTIQHLGLRQLALTLGWISFAFTLKTYSNATADSLYGEAEKSFFAGAYARAEQLSKQAASLFDQSNDLYRKTLANILVSELYYLNDKYDELEKLFPIVETDLKNIEENKELTLKHWVIKASYYRYTGRTAESRALFGKVLEMATSLQLADQFKIKMFRQLANFYLFVTEEYGKAVEMYDSALVYLEKTGGQPMEEFKCHWCIGQALTRQKQFLHADDHLSKCETFYQLNPELLNIHIAYIYSFKIEIYGALNNEAMMMAYFHKLHNLFKLHGGSIQAPAEKSKYYLNYVLSFINVSDYYKKIGDNNKALDMLENAIKEFEGLDFHLQFLYDRMGWLYLANDNTDMARKYADRLLALQHGLGGAKNPDLADTYYLISEVEGENGNYRQQIKYLNQALHIPGISEKTKLKTLTWLGISHSNLTEYGKALEYLEQSLVLNSGSIDIERIQSQYSPEKVIESEWLFRALFEKAMIYCQMAKTNYPDMDLLMAKKANPFFKNSIELYDKYIYNLDSDFDVAFMLREKRNKIKHYLQYLIEMHQSTGQREYLDMAFRFIEKSKSNALNLSFVENEAKIIGQIPITFIKKERALDERITNLVTRYRKEISKSATQTPNLEKVSNELNALRNEKNELINYFENEFPEYYYLKYNPKTISVNEVITKLDQRQALIQYYMSGNYMLSIYVSDEVVDFHECEIDEKFHSRISELKHHIESNHFQLHDQGPFDRFKSASLELYQHLIKPFEKYTAGKDLFIVPDSELALLPFDVLITSETKMGLPYDYKNLPFLIKNNGISYAFSATVLFSDINTHDNGFNNIIAFAPVQYPDKSVSQDLKYISGTEDEVKSIAQIFPTRMFLKERATEHSFKEVASRKSILHLAMHTLIDETDAMNSRMIFHPDDFAKGEDGILYTYEIYNMKLNAPLVVLSSCQSGYGNLKHGEGYKSLAWGFKYAGVPSIVMTLWPVSDKASVGIMKGFYKQLKKGKTKVYAMQSAKTVYLEHCDPLKSHPFFWASYSVVGDISPLKVEHVHSFKYFAFLLVYVLMFFIFALKKKTKKDLDG
jgi:CHAT domain-containing protein